jgi:hypothetical protein
MAAIRGAHHDPCAALSSATRASTELGIIAQTGFEGLTSVGLLRRHKHNPKHALQTSTDCAQ